MKKNVLFLLLFTVIMALNVNAQSPTFWGMTSKGGDDGVGVIFKTDGNGNNLQVQKSFEIINSGIEPANIILCEANNGKLYGTTRAGGINNYGVIFEYDPASNTYTKKLDFDGTNKGAYPFGGLIQASNGKLYGMTFMGGTNNMGVFYEYDPSINTYIKKFDFDGTNNGSYPFSSLIQASNGKLYGMTYYGGANNYGVIFEYDPSTDLYTKKLDFDVTNGANPYGSLIQASNGNLYGMTCTGGSNNMGVIFEYDPATDIYTKKLDFDGTSKGNNPFGSLLQASNGKFYGMTYEGGANDYGVIFEYDPATDIYTKKLDFDATNGAHPNGSLMQASNGKLYGMTAFGGANDKGIIFEYDLSTDTYTKKLDFDGANKGTCPKGGLVQALNGKLYGVTYLGGANESGVLFEYDISNDVFIKKIDFNYSPMGSLPQGSFIYADNSKFYGMTSWGGMNNKGVFFEYDPATNTYTKKLDFDGINKGANPFGSLIQASNGKLYGMTSGGGTNNKGILFEYDPITDIYTKKLNFDGTNNGDNPYGSLIQASNGKLYGITKLGGTYNYGVLFEYDPATNTYTKKLDFDGTNYGSYPHGDLVEALNGKLYGMTHNGGAYDYGVLFEYDPATNIYTKKLDFDGINGKWPLGSLMQANNSKLYGMTNDGGNSNNGVLFEYDPSTSIYTKKLDFNGTNNGSGPYGNLIQASNGKLYGMTPYGGVNYSGVLFEYDLTTDTYSKKMDFDGSNGSNPYGSLIEINTCIFTTSTIDTTVCNSYTVPSGNSTYTVSGTYEDRIPNSCGADSIITINLTVHYSQTGDTTAVACDNFTWFGNTYTSSGDYSETLQTINGCDSTVTLHLTIHTVDASVNQNGDTLIANATGASYQWIDCNNGYAAIPGATNQHFIPVVTGDYAVVVTENTCTDTSACYNVVITGVSSIVKDNSINIYPNPTTGNINISLSQKPISVTVTDITGAVIYQTKDTNKHMAIDLSHYANSVYFVKIKTSDGISTFKIIKQ